MNQGKQNLPFVIMLLAGGVTFGTTIMRLAFSGLDTNLAISLVTGSLLAGIGAYRLLVPLPPQKKQK